MVPAVFRRHQGLAVPQGMVSPPAVPQAALAHRSNCRSSTWAAIRPMTHRERQQYHQSRRPCLREKQWQGIPCHSPWRAPELPLLPCHSVRVRLNAGTTRCRWCARSRRATTSRSRVTGVKLAVAVVMPPLACMQPPLLRTVVHDLTRAVVSARHSPACWRTFLFIFRFEFKSHLPGCAGGASSTPAADRTVRCPRDAVASSSGRCRGWGMASPGAGIALS